MKKREHWRPLRRPPCLGDYGRLRNRGAGEPGIRGGEPGGRQSGEPVSRSAGEPVLRLPGSLEGT